MTTFVDRVVLHVAAGDGGHGVASVKREKFKPLGGPDGGNGGRGGNVILRVDPNVTTLLDYHHHPHRKATNGKPGAGDERNGADGGDLVLPVPEGTVVKDGSGEVLDGPGRRSTPSSSSAKRWPRAAWATRRSPRPGARRPASPCSASPATRSTSSSSSSRSPTSR